MTDIVTHTMDYKTTEHWCNAMRREGDVVPYPSIVLDRGNILEYAIKQDVWFTPDRDPHTNDILHNDRLEQFRLACLYDATSNLLDIGVNLDDDVKDTVEWIRLLTQHAGTGEPSNLMWLINGDSFSLVMRTLRLNG
jgi:hypothetical protein